MILRHSKMSLLLCLLVDVFVSTAALPMENNATSLSSNIQKDKITDKPSSNGDNSSLKKNNLGTTKDKSLKTKDNSSKTADRSAVHSDKTLNDDPATMKANSMLNDGSTAVDGEFNCYVESLENDKSEKAERSCGYEYKSGILHNAASCRSAGTTPIAGLYLPPDKEHFVRLSQGNTEAVLTCTCNGTECNKKGGEQNCILKAFAVDAVGDAINNNVTIEKLVQCIIKGVTLSNIWKVPEVVVTSSLPPPPAVECACSNSSVDASSNSTSNSDSVALPIAAGIGGGALVFGGTIGFAVGCLVMRGRNKEAKDEPKHDAKPPRRSQKKSQRTKKSREEKNKSQEDKKSHEEPSPVTTTSPAKETSTNGKTPAKTATTEPAATTPENEVDDMGTMEMVYRQMQQDANVSKSTSEKKNADKRLATRIQLKKPKSQAV